MSEWPSQTEEIAALKLTINAMDAANIAALQRAGAWDVNLGVVRSIEALAAEIVRLHVENEPSPCVMTHTPPFDFAQCETHDETFPLGGTCRFQGREEWEVYADEADEQRQRAVEAEIEIERLRVEADKLRDRSRVLAETVVKQTSRTIELECAYEALEGAWNVWRKEFYVADPWARLV